MMLWFENQHWPKARVSALVYTDTRRCYQADHSISFLKLQTLRQLLEWAVIRATTIEICFTDSRDPQEKQQVAEIECCVDFHTCTAKGFCLARENPVEAQQVVLQKRMKSLQQIPIAALPADSTA